MTVHPKRPTKKNMMGPRQPTSSGWSAQTARWSSRDALAGSADFFGINYYRRNLVRFSPRAPGLVTLLPGPGPLSDSGVEIYPAGFHAIDWSGRDDRGRPLSSGVYFAQLSAGGVNRADKMVLLK